MDGGEYMPRSGKPWTTVEVRALRAAYSAGGLASARRAVPGRSDSSLLAKAAAIDVQAPCSTDAFRAWRERTDAEIRKLYESDLPWGAIGKLCKRLDVTRAYVWSRARVMGFQATQPKAKPWTKAEIELMHDTAHMGVNRASQQFRRHGFSRSAGAIQMRRALEQVTVNEAASSAGLRSTTELAGLFGVTDQTVRQWLKMGLRAERRGTDESARYLVRDADLRKWIADHPLRIHLNRIQGGARTWFITMLSGLEPRVGVSDG